MNSRERIEAALNHRQPDRVPIDLGGTPVTLSDSSGYVYDEAGIDRDKLKYVMDLKNVRRGRIKEYADEFKGAVYTASDPKLDHNSLLVLSRRLSSK